MAATTWSMDRERTAGPLAIIGMITGGVFGYLVGGAVGGVIGAVAGHLFDRYLSLIHI